MHTETVPLASAPHNPSPRGARAPLRAEIAKHTVGALAKGRARKADLLLVDLGEGAVVVKDFAGKGLWGRTIGRIQIGRETRGYRWLGDWPGVPRFLGRIDALALALERVDGRQLAFARDRHPEGREILSRLREWIDGLHAKGLAHLDLRGRENVLLRPDGRLVVVDLAGAVRLRPGGLLHALFFRFLAITDEAAYLKWKQLLDPERLTDEEQAFLHRFRRLRSFWIFNRKPASGTGLGL